MRTEVLVFLAGVAALPAQQVVVDPGGGGDYRTIQAAVDGSAGGTTILVRPGVYAEAVRIAGKGLNIVGVGGSAAEVVVTEAAGSALPVVSVVGQPASARTTIARLTVGNPVLLLPGPVGIDVDGGGGEVVVDEVNARRRIRLSSFAGRVFVTRTAVAGFSDRGLVPAAPAIEADGCGLLLLGQVNAVGATGMGDDPPEQGAAAVSVTDGAVELVWPLLRGGTGGVWGFAGIVRAADGGPGLRLVRAVGRMLGEPSSACIGGDARTPLMPPLPTGGAGVELVASRLELSALAPLGGAGPMPGPPTRVDAGSSLRTAVPALATIGRSSPLRVGATTTLPLFGAPGSFGAVVLALGSAHLPLPFGTVVVDPSRLLFPLPFALDGAGRGGLTLTFENDPLTLGVPVWAQPATVDAALTLRVGGATAGVVQR